METRETILGLCAYIFSLMIIWSFGELIFTIYKKANKEEASYKNISIIKFFMKMENTDLWVAIVMRSIMILGFLSLVLPFTSFNETPGGLFESKKEYTFYRHAIAEPREMDGVPFSVIAEVGAYDGNYYIKKIYFSEDDYLSVNGYTMDSYELYEESDSCTVYDFSTEAFFESINYSEKWGVEVLEDEPSFHEIKKLK